MKFWIKSIGVILIGCAFGAAGAMAVASRQAPPPPQVTVAKDVMAELTALAEVSGALVSVSRYCKALRSSDFDDLGMIQSAHGLFVKALEPMKVKAGAENVDRVVQSLDNLVLAKAASPADSCEPNDIRALTGKQSQHGNRVLELLLKGLILDAGGPVVD